MRFLPDNRKLRVAVVGFGYVGSCIGLMLADLGHQVVGIDSDPGLVERFAAGQHRFAEPEMAEVWSRLPASARPRVSGSYADAADADVIIISVGTPIDDSREMLGAELSETCRQLRGSLRAGQLVILKSTVAPGTTRGMVLPLLEADGLAHGRDFGLAYCPERLAEGSALRQLRTLPVIVGGCSPDATAAAAAFWRRTLGVTTVTVQNPEAAEFVKLAGNWWIDVNVAIGNELAQVCAVFGVDVLEVIHSANTLAKGDGKVNILLPSVGVGGSCLTKDPWMLWRTARDKGVHLRTIETARMINDGMPRYTFELLRSELAKLGKDTAGAVVAVLGLSFKSNTGDVRMTPVKPVVDALLAAGAEVRVFDPLVAAADTAACVGMPPAATLQEAVEGADCVAVLAGHREFAGLDFADLACRVAMPCLVLDGRAYYPAEVVEMLRRLGFAYRGIGR
jgi:dTDP-alpha-D-glucose dehydrogenase